MSSITTQPDSLLGRHVIYKLSEYDVREIIQKRRGAGTATASGNDPREGDEYPAIIVKPFGSLVCNLQVFLDGTDVFWATSRSKFNPETDGQYALDTTVNHTSNPGPAAQRTKEFIPDAKGHWFEL